MQSLHRLCDKWPSSYFRATCKRLDKNMRDSRASRRRFRPLTRREFGNASPLTVAPKQGLRTMRGTLYGRLVRPETLPIQDLGKAQYRTQVFRIDGSLLARLMNREPSFVEPSLCACRR